MASPYTWATTTPADTDIVSQYPALARARQSTLGVPSATGGVLGTLVPYGTPTTGWRVLQDDNKVWVVTNAYITAHGGAPAQDDATKASYGFFIDPATNNSLQVVYMAAGQTSWTVLGEFLSVASAVNYVRLLASATGTRVELDAIGTDSNIDIFLNAKGASSLAHIGANGQYVADFSTVASNVNRFEFDNSATNTPVVIKAVGTDAAIGINLVPKGTGTVQISGTSIYAAASVTHATTTSPTTTSSTYNSTGEGVTITPATSGRVLVLHDAAVRVGASAQAFVHLFQTTTGIPAANAATTGSQVGNESGVNPDANMVDAVCNHAIATGLTLGTAYSFYLAFRNNDNATTISYPGLGVGQFTAIEF